MLERLHKPRYRFVSTPSEDALRVLDIVLQAEPDPEIAEIGVGIGATSLALAERLDQHGVLHLFDYEDRAEGLKVDLAERGFANVEAHANSRALFDSYSWNLGRLAAECGPEGRFHFAYLDGAHSFMHDAAATVLLMRLVRVGGFLLMDDYGWTFAKSPTLNPDVNPGILEQYTREQLEVPHVKLVCELFLDPSPDFEVEFLDGQISRARRLYRRLR
ncbi:MAG: class I SAM-dependent methyltransferase [Pseudomonadota bacterium]